MKNPEAVTRRFSQWCNLTFAQRFWATKACLWASKIFKICVWLPDWANNFLKSNFENYARYSLIKWYQFLSIYIIQHEQYHLIMLLIGLKAATLLKKRLWQRCFPAKFLGKIFYRTYLGDCFWIKFCKCQKEACEGTSLVKFLQSCHFNIK